jgi:RNA-directed DNA polymerase
LADLILYELDREFDRRGLRFVRYADDCNVYMRSERAARRAFENLTGFIEGVLKWRGNRANSAAAVRGRASSSGSASLRQKAKPRIAPQASEKMKDLIRELTRKSHRSFRAVMTDLRRHLVGCPALRRAWFRQHGLPVFPVEV